MYLKTLDYRQLKSTMMKIINVVSTPYLCYVIFLCTQNLKSTHTVVSATPHPLYPPLQKEINIVQDAV